MAISLTHTTVAVGTDAGNGEIGKAQWNEAHTLTMATGNLLGRSTSGTGAAEEIAIGTGLDLTGGTLSSTVTATPGGSDTQVQFNDGGSFGGDAGLTFNKTTGRLTLGTSGQAAFSTDLLLTRKAAANLRFGAADAAAPVAQTLSVQSVVAGTTNTAGANLTITGSQGTGTGAGGEIIWQFAPSGSSGTAQNALVTAVRSIANISGGGSGTQIYDNSGTRNILVGSDGNGALGFLSSTGMYSIRTGQYVNTLNINASGLHTAGTSQVISFNGGYNSTSATGDVILARDAANTLAQRNGANAQTQRLYGTFTDASNYRRLAMTMSTAGVAEIKPEGAGTGASGNVIHISGLPTSNPGPGILWNDGGTPAIGT